MSGGKDFGEVVEVIVKQDTRYDKDAYHFLRKALDFTIRDVREKDENRPDHHISGQELLEGIRRYAIEQFGPMTPKLFSIWGVEETLDFGNIVFNLVDYGVFGKTDTDSHEDFVDVYDFYDVFEKPYLPKSQCNRER